MDELLKIMTPQNFAMLISIYLLVRFEKVITSLQNEFDRMGQLFSRSIDRNTRILTILTVKLLKNGDGEFTGSLQELLEIPPGDAETGRKKEE